MSKNDLTRGRKFASKYYPQTKLAVVRGVESSGKDTYVIYERTFKGSYNTVTSVDVLEKSVFLDEYKAVDDFFVAGGEYKYAGSTLYVKEVFTISNPINQKYRKQARALVINPDGKRYMEMLDGYTFEASKRVK